MLNFSDKKFDINETQQYKLSIQIYLDGFLFCVCNAAGNCLAARYSPFSNIDDLKNILACEALIRKQYADVRCIIVSQKYALVPLKLFDENRPADYLDLVCSATDDEEIVHRKIDALEAECVFAINKQIETEIRKQQPNVKFYHQSIPLVHAALKQNGNNVFVCFNKTFIDIVVCKNKQLLLCNSYKIESLADSEYFVALVISKLSISADKIYVSGKIGKDDFDDLKKIFAQAEFDVDQNIMFAMSGENALQIQTLMKLNQCE